MDWKALGQEVAKLGLPLLGAALPLPGGMAIGTALAAMVGSSSAKPEDILTALTTNADALQKAHEFEETHQEKMLEITTNAEIESRKADSADIASVNEVLKADSQGSSYWQKNHHAYETSFTLLMVAAIYVVLPAAKVPVPAVPGDVWIMIGAILGVAAWHGGAALVARAKAGQ